MSSNLYSATLTPDPWLRIVVLTSGRLLQAAGIAIVLTLPLAIEFRVLGLLLWVALSVAELRRCERAYDCCSCIRLRCDGSVEVRNGDDEWLPGSLATGSLVLASHGWLRIRLDDGSEIDELLRGDARRSHDWRRLQVIWRHIGAAP
jgi:hypothetical protein